MKAKTTNLTAQQKAKILGDVSPQSAPSARVGSPNPLAALHTVCADSPRRLISLWDMIEFDIKNLIATLEILHSAKLLAQEQFPKERDDFENFIKSLMLRVDGLSQQARRLELVKTDGRCGGFADELLEVFNSFPDVWNGTANSCDILPPQAVVREIDGIEKTIRDELEKKLFAFVPSAKAQFFEQEALLGPKFRNPICTKINSEIKAAGNCLAGDLNTAAVFHLMRAAELGLRRLAKRLRVKLKYTLLFADSVISFSRTRPPACPAR